MFFLECSFFTAGNEEGTIINRKDLKKQNHQMKTGGKKKTSISSTEFTPDLVKSLLFL